MLLLNHADFQSNSKITKINFALSLSLQIALQLLPILQVIVILWPPTIHAVPVYGTKRYGRSAIMHRPVLNTQPYQQLVRTQRYPMNYYDMYPYSQSYLDDYYHPQESYPLYYPARTSKYEVYQAVMPYYYNDRPVMRPNYYYGYADGAEPMANVEEEILQESEREEREDAQPIGQEMYYENDSPRDDNLDDINAAFLQNLIMTQMYNDAMTDQQDDYAHKEDDVYGKWEEYPSENKNYYQEDEDVRELKNLASKSDQLSVEDRRHWFDKGTHPSQPQRPGNHHNNNWEIKRSDAKNLKSNNIGDRKRITIPTTTESSLMRKETGGQKEEVLPRPATPARHPFSNQVLSMMTKSEDERKKSPSVYDTIKHMLDMEKSLDNVRQYFNVKFNPNKKETGLDNTISISLFPIELHIFPTLALEYIFVT